MSNAMDSETAWNGKKREKTGREVGQKLKG